jgi:hypothetical protein
VPRNAKRLTAAITLLAGLLAIAAPAGAAQSKRALQNIPLSGLPAACTTAPDGNTCVNAVVVALDAARTSLGYGPYVLPADFDSLSGTQQIFVLTNLDRVARGLPPIAGIASSLQASTEAGVLADADPDPTSVLTGLSTYTWTSDWAGGWYNAPYAYYEWMYDDGYAGSETSNVDCTGRGASGCWDHRRNLLAFAERGTIAMGATVGTDAHGQVGYAITIVWTPQSSWTSYSYTWSQAQAAGAGGKTATRRH